MSLVSRDRLDRLSSGFMASRVLLTAVELNLFTVLGKNAVGAEEAAGKTRSNPRALERLMNALVGIGMLTKSKGLFRNTSATLTHLVDDAPEPLKHIMLHRATMWSTWSPLTDVVRKGKAHKRHKSKEQEDRFIRGMADVGLRSAAETARLLKKELRAAKKLLDLGGGPGIYGCEFAKYAPELSVTVFDKSGPLKVARETIKARGLEERIKTRSGDALKASIFKDKLKEKYDIVFMSNLVHCFRRRDAEKLIKHAALALKPGGHLIIKDFYIQKAGTAPTFSALFSINMLAAGAGDAYPRAEVESWMTLAGVKPAGHVSVAEASGILLGVKT